VRSVLTWLWRAPSPSIRVATWSLRPPRRPPWLLERLEPPARDLADLEPLWVILSTLFSSLICMTTFSSALTRSLSRSVLYLTLVNWLACLVCLAYSSRTSSMLPRPSSFNRAICYSRARNRPSWGLPPAAVY
jgi:hypothetical protein